MKRTTLIRHFVPAFALAIALSLSSAAFAFHESNGHDDDADNILIRRTIPDPQAVKRTPLTSDRLSTTSTRYIDARRGLRPYSSGHCDILSHQRYAAYDDHFGISRPENRPWSYSHRTPRTNVTQFRNEHAGDNQAQPAGSATAPAATITANEQPREDNPEKQVDMKIRVHDDTSAIPTTTGAVLITADGTVIQVGD